MASWWERYQERMRQGEERVAGQKFFVRLMPALLLGYFVIAILPWTDVLRSSGAFAGVDASGNGKALLRVVAQTFFWLALIVVQGDVWLRVRQGVEAVRKADFKRIMVMRFAVSVVMLLSIAFWMFFLSGTPCSKG